MIITNGNINNLLKQLSQQNSKINTKFHSFSNLTINFNSASCKAGEKYKSKRFLSVIDLAHLDNLAETQI